MHRDPGDGSFWGFAPGAVAEGRRGAVAATLAAPFLATPNTLHVLSGSQAVRHRLVVVGRFRSWSTGVSRKDTDHIFFLFFNVHSGD